MVLRIEDEDLFRRIKARIDPLSYVECGLCGAARVAGIALTRSINAYMKDYSGSDEGEDEEEYDRCEAARKLLEMLADPEPEFDFTDSEEVLRWLKWRDANLDRLCGVLNPDDDGRALYLRYSEAVVFREKTCACFKRVKKAADWDFVSL